MTYVTSKPRKETRWLTETELSAGAQPPRKATRPAWDTASAATPKHCYALGSDSGYIRFPAARARHLRNLRMGAGHPAPGHCHVD